MNERDSVANAGTVVSIRGSVVDIKFDERLPPIYSVLRAGTQGQIIIRCAAAVGVRRQGGTVRWSRIFPRQ